MYIRTSHSNKRQIPTAIIFGQINSTHEIICEVTEIPVFEYQEVTETYDSFEQSLHEPKFGTQLSIKNLIEITGYKALLSEQEINEAQTIGELMLKVGLNSALAEIDALALAILELMGV